MYGIHSSLLDHTKRCQVPVGVHTRVNKENGTLYLRGAVLSVDGVRCVQGEMEAPISDPEALGVKLAQELKQQGAAEILQEIFDASRS